MWIICWIRHKQRCFTFISFLQACSLQSPAPMGCYVGQLLYKNIRSEERERERKKNDLSLNYEKSAHTEQIFIANSAVQYAIKLWLLQWPHAFPSDAQNSATIYHIRSDHTPPNPKPLRTPTPSNSREIAGQREAQNKWNKCSLYTCFPPKDKSWAGLTQFSSAYIN